MTIAVAQTVKDLCKPHPMALDYAISDQIEHLTDLLDEAEKDAEGFFERNFVTAGMKTLLRQGLSRLAGKSDQAVFELKQAMGGGKTHSMLALGLLARNPLLRHHVPADVSEGLPPVSAKVVTINGRSVSRDIFLWGDIATQLGKREEFAEFWKNGAEPPLEQDWLKLIGDEPTLILLDELPPYFDAAIAKQVGGGTLANVTTFALSNLLSAALKLKRLCIVISNLSGSYEGATKDLSKAIQNFQQETNRQAKAITPVELASSEIYDILRKRLFKELPPPAVIESVASAYAAALSEAVRSKSIGKSSEQIAQEIHRSYPFHPAVKHLVALFKENESYRQTRGLMQFVSKMIKSVWERQSNEVFLIGCQHLDLSIADVREEINKISNLQGAIATDVASAGEAHAEAIDANLGTDAASQIARTLLVASLSESVDAVKGLTKQQVIEWLVAPHRQALEFDSAFDDLRKECWYLHRKENDAWYFSNTENLRKRIENRAKTAPQPKIDAETKRRLEEAFEPKQKLAFQTVLALPLIDEIKLSGPRLCLVLSPDSKSPPQDAQRLFDEAVEKNNFCVVTGDGSSMGSLEEKVRRIWAIAKVREETGGDKSPHLTELEEEAEQAEFDFNSALVTLFNRVWFPHKSGLVSAKLQIAPGGKRSQPGETIVLAGEAAVQSALTSTGASKLDLDVQGQSDRLFERAEDMLWPTTEKRIPWRDVTTRALSNPRWIWLPPKGLETLREKAIGQDRWRYSQDGYIEKGPFPPPCTSVSIAERDYDDSTGRATIEVTAKDAGPHGRVHFSTTPEVSASSPVVSEAVYETDATVLYFLAIDPDGKCPPGDVRRWSNKLTLTHQPQTISGKRIVELTVRPRGTIRWNTKGTNRKEGQEYAGPIELEGDKEVTVYSYAEDQGVSTERDFTIPPPDQKGVRIDKAKPAKLRRPQTFTGNGPAFECIGAAKNAKAAFTDIQVWVGQGGHNSYTRFGSESLISAEHIEKVVALAREALGEPTSEVKILYKGLSFPTGHDLEAFLTATGSDAGAQEIEQ